MTSGVPARFNHTRVIAKFKDGITLTEIANGERVHRSCISQYLKSLGFTIVPSRHTGPSKFYKQDLRIAKALAMIERGKRVLASYNLDEAAALDRIRAERNL